MKAKAAGQYLPMYTIAGNRDMYKPLPVNQTPRSFYNVIRAFALLNGITGPTPGSRGQRDVRAKARWTWLEQTRRPPRHGRKRSNHQGVMIQLVALDPYGHWNFKPAAEECDVLSRFRRNVTTGALQVESTR